VEQLKWLGGRGKYKRRVENWRRCCNGSMMEETKIIHHGFIVSGWRCPECKKEIVDPVDLEKLISNYEFKMISEQ